MSRKRLGLALSGGGARGVAHVGFLHVLDREGIPIDCIAGASAGSLAGAAYAGGIRGTELVELARQVRWRDLARPDRSRRGLFHLGPLEAFLVQHLGDVTFGDLELPYAALAADPGNGELVVLKEGRLAPAVCASCAVPGVFVPVDVGGRILVDGGVINNLPISAVRALGADVVVGVGLFAPPDEPPCRALDILTAAVDHLLLQAGDDPASADVYVPVPLHGLASLVRLSSACRERAFVLGCQSAEEALPAIRAALA
jgi:NTE family protein